MSTNITLDTMVEVTEKAAAVLQAYQAQVAASKPQTEQLEKVAQSLIDAKLIDVTQKDDAIRALNDHKSAVDLIGDIVNLTTKQAAEAPPAAAGRPVSAPESYAANDEWAQELYKLAAAARA